VVEDVSKRREPLPQMVGIYFVAPTDDSIKQLTRDFALATAPQYKSVHVFFSSKPSPQHLAAIRECPHLVSRLRTLKEVRRFRRPRAGLPQTTRSRGFCCAGSQQRGACCRSEPTAGCLHALLVRCEGLPAAPRPQVNLEYLLVHSRTFITSEDDALRTFFGAAVDSSTSYRVEIEVGGAAA
jgi:hypothetical protein